MAYAYEVTKYYVVRKNGEYPWPCLRDKKRTIELFTHDVLTKSGDGTFFKHTGMGCYGIILKPNQIKKSSNVAKLIVS